jgi:hypothetical protein
MQALEGLVHFASVQNGQQADRMNSINERDIPDWRVRAAEEAYRIADAMLQVRASELPPTPEEARRRHYKEYYANLEKTLYAQVQTAQKGTGDA